MGIAWIHWENNGINDLIVTSERKYWPGDVGWCTKQLSDVTWTAVSTENDLKTTKKNNHHIPLCVKLHFFYIKNNNPLHFGNFTLNSLFKPTMYLLARSMQNFHLRSKKILWINTQQAALCRWYGYSWVPRTPVTQNKSFC